MRIKKFFMQSHVLLAENDELLLLAANAGCIDYTKYTGKKVIIRPKNMTANQLQAGYNRFTRDYYRIMEIVYRAFKQPNAVATII